jgi:two-component system OmpR family sensor kinase
VLSWRIKSFKAHTLLYRLQSTTLLAVLAGYGILLVANNHLANLQRHQIHQQLLIQFQNQWLLDPPSKCENTNLGPWLQIVCPANGVLPPDPKGEIWMSSRVTMPLASGNSVPVLLRRNFTQSLHQQSLSQQLLIVVAGISGLFTSLLLRPVLHFGLVRPLRRLGQQLDASQGNPASVVQLAVAEQPEELRMIARSFNRLGQRLMASWSHQKTFVDGLAHELRTPITLISGHTQRLLRQPLDPSMLRSVQQIDAETRAMAGMVSALLELARQDASRMSLQLQSLDPKLQLLLCYERLQPSSAGRLRLLPLGDTELPALTADAERLQQCLAALVDNALSYTPISSEVQLGVTAEDGDIILHVSDKGPGVPDSEKFSIFGRLVRGSSAKEVRGSGIGLALVALLMKAMGGTADVVDVAGGGADFRLHLPISS